MLFGFFARDAKRGNRASLQPSWFDWLFAIQTDSESAFLDASERFVDFHQQKAFAVAKFEHEVLVYFAGGEIGLIRKVVRRYREFRSHRIFRVIQNPLFLFE